MHPGQNPFSPQDVHNFSPNMPAAVQLCPKITQSWLVKDTVVLFVVRKDFCSRWGSISSPHKSCMCVTFLDTLVLTCVITYENLDYLAGICGLSLAGFREQDGSQLSI